MNKIVIGLIAVAIIGGGFFAVSASQKAEKMKMEEKAMMEKEAMEMEQKALMQKEALEKNDSFKMDKDGETMEKETMEKEVMIKAEGETMMKKDEGAMMNKTSDEAMMKKEPEAMMASKGSYEAYSASKLALADKGDVVLFFKASWCPSCKTLDADIKANIASIPAGVTILEVNYDTETALKQKYAVTYQHTLVQVASDGTLIAKWSGSPTLAELVTKIK